MAIATSFEELECWQEARQLVKIVFLACDAGKLSKDFGTANQLRRAAMSIMNNIAEGFGRKGAKEFLRFLDMAQSSALEVKSMTYTLDDLEYLPENLVEGMRVRADKVRRMIRGLIKYIENREVE